jgi:predicted AlkP superfamily phosphohydrolase/phosphomutase
MTNKPPRAIVVGVDSLSAKLLYRFANDGCLPNVARLMAQGAALAAMPCIPAYTPTNWATLATGAWPGTHGAGLWHDVTPGGAPPGGRPISTFDSRAILAETIWESAERQGLTSLVIAYPGSYPSRLERGMVVAPLPKGLLSWDLLAGREYCAGVSRPGAAELSLTAAAGSNAPPGSLQAVLRVVETASRQADAVGAVEDGAAGRGSGTAGGCPSACSGGLAFRLVLPKGVSGYGRALLFDEPNGDAPAAEMQPGEWSPWLIRGFPTDGGRPSAGRIAPASVRFKLLELAPDATRVRLLRSAVYPTTGFTEPQELSPELIRSVGPYFEHAAMAHHVDFATYEESVYDEMEYQVDWHVQAAGHLLATRGWDLFYNHWHFPDTVQHHFMSQADPDSPNYDPARAERYLAVLRRAYELSDRLLGGMMRLAGPETHVALVSDHGNASNKHVCHLDRRLRETGLLRRVGDADDDEMDWANTLAYAFGGFMVNVNLRGREARGVVDPAQYERVVNRTIDALHEWKTQEGLRPVALALRKRDAAVIGYWGERTGDVVFIYNAGFAWGHPGAGLSVAPASPGANHGPQVPTAETALSSNLGVWVIAGPGIKPGYARDAGRIGPARLIDFVPTLCHALDIAPPAQCQGAVEYDLFER